MNAYDDYDSATRPICDLTECYNLVDHEDDTMCAGCKAHEEAKTCRGCDAPAPMFADLDGLCADCAPEYGIVIDEPTLAVAA